jgi:hypothetical protein
MDADNPRDPDQGRKRTKRKKGHKSDLKADKPDKGKGK